MFATILIFLGCLWFLLKYFHYSNKPDGTPPGTLGIPIIGISPPSNSTFEEYINNCRKKYGDTFWLKMGSRNVVFICNYEVIVTTLNNPALQGRPDFFSNTIINKGKVNGIIMSEGAAWRDLRRFSIRRLREGGMGKSSMESIILREADALADDFEKHVGQKSELPWSINASVLNVIWTLASGKRYDVGDFKMTKLYHTVQDMFNQIQSPTFVLLELMPWISNYSPNFIMNLFGKKTFEQKVDKLSKLIYQTVDEHKKTLDEDNPRDLIDSYLIELNKLKDPSSHSEINSHFCETELVYTILDIFLAGSETTSSTIRWYIMLMAKYPQVQNRVHEELDKVFPSNRAITLQDKDKLPYLEATINETMRLKPITPFGIFHLATESTTVDDYIIPKGTLISPNFQACHKNPTIWKNPTEFYPEHFLNEDNTINHKKKGFLAFSTGKRVCIGENLARMDLYFMLATLMKKFSFSAAEGESINIEQRPDQPFFTLPQPCNIIINKR